METAIAVQPLSFSFAHFSTEVRLRFLTPVLCPKAAGRQEGGGMWAEEKKKTEMEGKRRWKAGIRDRWDYEGEPRRDKGGAMKL